jgi:pimeloyl-ACP methyl ester carboxylesterase
MSLLIILHGWGSSKEKWQKVKELLQRERIKVIIPDLPGFKKETELKNPWDLAHYVKWFAELLKELEKFYPELKQGFFLLGHSFGGRISIKFTAAYQERVKSLILVSSAGIKRDSASKKILRKLSKLLEILKIKNAKPYQFLRRFFYRFVLGKTDYLKAKGALKETMKKVIDEDLTPLLKNISVPTLIIWGRKDKITPLKDAFLMKKLIKNSSLEILETSAHTPYLDNPKALAQEIISFIKGQK